MLADNPATTHPLLRPPATSPRRMRPPAPLWRTGLAGWSKMVSASRSAPTVPRSATHSARLAQTAS
eukprot:SAG11_NODE_11823_length_736_cov_1.474097_1_plen_65_part_10